MKTTLFCKLMERAPQQEGKVWEVTVIKAGVSKNNNLYTKEVLDRACPLFEGAPVGIYEFVDAPGRQEFDHAPQWIRDQYPGGVAKNIVGWLRDVHMEGDEMVANLHVTDEWLRKTLVEAWTGGNKELLELSIEARGPSRDEASPEGRVRRVESIDEAIELTVVRKGAAGGKFRRLVASTSEDQPDRVELVYGGGSYHVVLGNTILASNQDLQEARKSWIGILESAPKPEKENQMEEELNTQDTSEVVAEEIQEAAEEIIEEVIPQVESELKESSRSRSSMVKALRTLGHNDSLDEATTQEVYKLLNSKIAEAAGLKKISESQQNDLMLALQALKSGDSESAILTLESLLVQASMEDDCEEAAVQTEGANMKEYKMDIQNKSESQLESEALLADLRAQVAAAKELQESTRALNESLAKSNAAALIESTIAKSGLPEVAKTQFRKKYEGRTDVTGLAEDISASRELLESVATANAPVRSQISMGASPLDHYSAMADMICGFNPGAETSLNESQKDLYRGLPQVASIRRWYQEVMDDNDLSFKRGKNSVLNEAVSADLPQLLGDSMYRTLRQRYETQSKDWMTIAEDVPVDNFKVRRNVLLGGLGILPKVVESDVLDNYVRLGMLADEEITYNVDTRGGLIVVSRQAIINDDLQGIRRAPIEAAESANHTLNMAVFQAAIGAKVGAINTDTSYDGTVLYHANHRNLGTTALGYQSMIDSWTRILNQTRYGNVGTNTVAILIGDATITLSAALYEALQVGDVFRIEAESILVTSKNGANVVGVTRGYAGTAAAGHLINLRAEQESTLIQPKVVTCMYPLELQSTAQTLFNSTFVPGSPNNDKSYVNGLAASGQIVPLSVNKMYLKYDLNNWFMFSDKPVQVGFLGGRRTPELFLQDNPLVNGVFSGDRISWKVRHEYGIASPDHRCIDGNIVA